MGIPSTCESYWLPKGTYVTLMQLYYLRGTGIVGTTFKVSNGDYRVYGDIS